MLRLRAAPAGFIIPCQPMTALKPPSGSGWVHEIKHDGYRMMARWDGAGRFGYPNGCAPKPRQT